MGAWRGGAEDIWEISAPSARLCRKRKPALKCKVCLTHVHAQPVAQRTQRPAPGPLLEPCGQQSSHAASLPGVSWSAARVCAPDPTQPLGRDPARDDGCRGQVRRGLPTPCPALQASLSPAPSAKPGSLPPSTLPPVLWAMPEATAPSASAGGVLHGPRARPGSSDRAVKAGLL